MRVLLSFFLFSLGALAFAQDITIDGEPAPAGTKVAITLPDSPPDVTSPTGREPKFIWTAAWQKNYQRARDENHPWWQLIKSNADRTGTANQRYGDNGQWCAFVYQVTGDVAYARKAIPLATNLARPASANHVREHTIQAVVLYDWLLPAMTPEEKQAFEAGLKTVAEYILAIEQPPYTGGISTADSDQLVGGYFGLALMDAALGTDYLNQSTQAGSKIAIGGLIATAVDRSTVRNTIADYCHRARGGQWIESSEYNLGTTHLLLMGIAAHKTATGKDHFPEVTAFLTELRTSMLADLTADQKAAWQWGDVESPHSLDLDHRVRLMRSLGLNGVLPDGTSMLHRTFYLADPYAPVVTPPLNMVHRADGIGLLTVKDETKSFFSHMANRVGVHHDVNYLNNFRLYANGEWVIDHPLGYGRDNGNHVNGMLLAGLSSSGTSRGLVNTEVNEAEDYCVQTGKTGGPHYAAGYYNPPPEFLREWTRRVVYLPEYPVIVVYDSIDMDDPQTLLKFSQYRVADQNAIKAAPALKQWFLHTPVAPAIEGNKISWQTAGGQAVNCRTLAPATYATAVIDESTVFTSGFKASELKWHVKLLSDDATVFCNVISVGSEPAAALTGTTLVVGQHTIEFGVSVTVERK